MHFEAPFHDYVLNCHFVYLDIPGTCPFLIRKQNVFGLFIYNSKKKKERNSPLLKKHETGLIGSANNEVLKTVLQNVKMKILKL